MRRFFAFVLAWVVWVTLPGPAWGYTPPPIQGAVNDRAGLLSAAERATLERRIAEHRSARGFEIVVFTVASLGGESIEDVAYGAFNGWKVGRAGKDDGVLLVVAPNERKTRIETGKGAGGAITDLQSKRILSERVGPRLKEGNAFEGLRDGVESIASLMSGGPLVPDGGAEPRPTATAAETTPRTVPTYAPTSYFVDASGGFSAAERARYVKETEARVASGEAAAAVVVIPETERADLPSIVGANEAAFRKGLTGVRGIVIVRRSDAAGFGYGAYEAEGPGRDEFERLSRGLAARVGQPTAEARDAAIVDALLEAQAALPAPTPPGFFERHRDRLWGVLVLALVVAVVFFGWLGAKRGWRGGGGGSGGSSGGGSSYGGGSSSSGGGSSYGGGSSGGYSGGGGSSGGGGASDSY